MDISYSFALRFFNAFDSKDFLHSEHCISDETEFESIPTVYLRSPISRETD